ncbi:glucohydrolase [Carnobacterium divergens]|uniref:alpha-glucosidase n=1 Tax=Carnobacterium divergens TaxID=2748 RepID=UPI0010718F31|nr:alpha-glucosidase [Carnobacterium divergens]MDT1995961.1 alpha-glucosidase [Carnobacterium divergens]TFI67555.1 glucohydrolase [Carnobacterium divergens]TFI67676.1 glucohydrolase [Carnobacterium divergens]TFI71882.1 glucohydrolase [Carnobacterium divergens]TFI82589.1 glucohydrolase [Carnobacterium divergens]
MKKSKTTKDWWKEEVIYQVYPKSFKDSNNDGVGDIKGIKEKLPYLKELGITTLWICPIFTSPMVDNGYDIADFEGINPEFGTMEEFDELVAEAKKLEIKLMLDLVINHTSDEHTWFQQALADKKSKYREYYIFKEGKERPNNWRSIFGGSVWEKVPGEECYYLHVFDKKQPDLNWENPELRQELYQMINRWLEKGIAGFRIDSITFIKKDQNYESLPADGVDGLVSCKHKTRNQPGIEFFLNELKKETFEKYNCVTVGEAPGVAYDEFSDFIGEEGYFSMIFDFHYADIDVESGSDWFKRTHWTTKEFKELIIQSQEALQNAGWGANFIENHDQPRALSKLVKKEFQTAEAAKGIGAMYFFLRGTPFIYQGQELGMINAERHHMKQFDDISSIDNFYRAIQEGISEKEALNFVNLRSRDNSRTPMPWDNSQYGGFSNHQPWLAMTEEYPTINAAKNTVLEFYKKMIELRQNSPISPILKTGAIHFLKELPDSIIGYYRELGGEKIYSFTNLSPVSETLIVEKEVEVLYLTSHSMQLLGKEIKLAPYQSILVK